MEFIQYDTKDWFKPGLTHPIMKYYIKIEMKLKLNYLLIN